MLEREAFIRACLDRTQRIVDICDRFGISEKTGHKVLRRFREEGPQAFADRSHAPRHCAHRVAPEIEARIIALRQQYPLYGAAKLHDWLCRYEPAVRWPAPSTIGALLTRAGLIRPRRRRGRGAASRALGGTRTVATAPNEVWTADFKGEFRLGTGAYCYPLTVLDQYSRFLVGCVALPTTAVAPTRARFAQLFRTYGLPTVIRTDNGVPFAQPNTLGRLGTLAFWWVRLGIRPEHIPPATPSANAEHERFHRTLKAATVHPTAPTPTAQQARFDRYRTEYNTERPHASLPQHCPPATLYAPASCRPYPTRLPTLVYPTADDVRLVNANGGIKWRQHWIFLSRALAGQYVGLTTIETEEMSVAYGQLILGEFNPDTHRFTPRPRWGG
jgi:putative transposase